MRVPRPTFVEEPSESWRVCRGGAFERRRPRKLEYGLPTAVHARSDAYARRRRCCILHRRRAQQPQSRQAYADSMALAAAYGRPPEPRYEQPAPTYGDPGPYRAQEPLPSQLARPAKKKRPRRKHGELARGIVRRREDWDDHCLIEMDDGRVSVFT